jgi:DNA-binding protein H-NS
MGKDELEHMPIDDLWELYEKVCAILSQRITAEKKTLERRLELLQGSTSTLKNAVPADLQGEKVKRRKYPTVYPKYRNPERPSETWAGRGKQPKWVLNALKKGKQLEDLRIPEAATSDA